ncbi:MAG: TraM recognition domain-containing protein, partial [Gaiellales bacterium]
FDTVAKGGLVLFSLDSSRFGATAKLVGNLVIQELKAVCGQLENEPNLKRPSLLAVDEFSGLDADHIAGLFQRGRSAGMSVVLATQEFADMRRVDDDFCDQVVGNVEWILAGRQNNPESAELVAAIAGTEEVWTHTFQTEDRLSQLQKDGQFWRESGMGTKHVGREFLVSPDEIKRLGVGRAVLVEKNPNRTKVLKVRAPGERVHRMERRAA